jgi:hypothetical protein
MGSEAALEKDLGRQVIDLGPSDPTLSPVISVLPVPSGPLNERTRPCRRLR